MHFLPACVCWCQRWHTSGPLAERLRTDPAAAAQWATGGVRDLVLLPMVSRCCYVLQSDSCGSGPAATCHTGM